MCFTFVSSVINLIYLTQLVFLRRKIEFKSRTFGNWLGTKFVDPFNLPFRCDATCQFFRLQPWGKTRCHLSAASLSQLPPFRSGWARHPGCPGANVIKLFLSVTFKWRNKLECLSFANIFPEPTCVDAFPLCRRPWAFQANIWQG